MERQTVRSQYTIRLKLGCRGLSLIEVTVIIVLVGILAALALTSMTALLGDARVAETKREMEILANAIAGDPSIMSVAGGARSDFGYVGDVGALPPNLDALVENPGAYATWNGPYLPPSFNRETNDFKKDAWGVAYGYSGGVTITSTGSGSDIIKQIADNSADLLSNQVAGLIADVNDSIPNDEDTLNVDIVIIYPNGTGGLDTTTQHPENDGSFLTSAVPIGKHPLRVIYTPEVDTLLRYVSVMPRHSGDRLLRFNFESDYFSVGGATGLTPAPGSDTLYDISGGTCNALRFWIENTTAAPIQVDSIMLEYTATAYYQILEFDGVEEFNFAMPRKGPGEYVTFASTHIIGPESSVRVQVMNFRDTDSGTSSAVSMLNETVTFTLSDGSSFDMTFDYCE